MQGLDATSQMHSLGWSFAVRISQNTPFHLRSHSSYEYVYFNYRFVSVDWPMRRRVVV